MEALHIANDEKAPLLGKQCTADKHTAIQVTPLRRRDLMRAADTVHRAFAEDSLMMYYASADTAPFREARVKAQYGILFEDAIRRGRMLTVNNGEAVMRYGVPNGPRELGKWHTFFSAAIDKFDTAELAKRKAEFDAKVGAMVADVFGEKVADMYDVQAIATAPEAQRQGYGSALVTSVTDMGDADGHDVWLVTVDAYEFYEELGFSTIRSDSVGADNLNWKGDPVTVRIMHRPAKTAGSREKGAVKYFAGV